MISSTTDGKNFLRHHPRMDPHSGMPLSRYLAGVRDNELLAALLARDAEKTVGRDPGHFITRA